MSPQHCTTTSSLFCSHEICIKCYLCIILILQKSSTETSTHQTIWTLTQIWSPCAHISLFYLHWFATNIMFCCSTSNSGFIELCSLRSPAVVVLQCYFISCGLLVSLRDSHLWPLSDEVLHSQDCRFNSDWICSRSTLNCWWQYLGLLLRRPFLSNWIWQ